MSRRTFGRAKSALAEVAKYGRLAALSSASPSTRRSLPAVAWSPFTHPKCIFVVSLTLTKVDHPDVCHGWTWTILDENALARQVAQVALGQYRHVATILAGAGITDGAADHDQIDDAIELMSVGVDEDPWHRDGWIFQTISWIAAHQDGAGTATRPPHIIKAHKGFDGLQLELSTDGKAVIGVTVFEDKATEHPRKTVRDDVWPGIQALERGQRRAELNHETTALLDAQRADHPGLDVDQAISKILWKDARRYRVSITIGDTHHKNDKARSRLFKGYDDIAPGDLSKRRAETLYIKELRTWMKAFAERVVVHIKASASHV